MSLMLIKNKLSYRDSLIKAGAIAAVLYEVSNTLTKAAGTQVRLLSYVV